ncbi:MAG: type III pantothenate kinase [Deltaproteobacteria bacterium]|nr:type III pantothenate kinase [Deltaproteobacteria bacterium]
MLFVIDVGNTNIVLGLYDGERLAASWRVATRADRTADEYGMIILELFRHFGLEKSAVSGVILSCVVPALTYTFSTMAKRYFGLEALSVGPGMKTGIPILYDNPKEVGADRIVNAVAAYQRHRCALVVVDFGTATTFDAITSKGEYAGGAIAPGIDISMDALFVHAAKLPRVEVARPKAVIGKNTVHSMQAGTYFGYVGLVQELVGRMKKELDAPSRVVATGGLAGLIAKDASCIDEVDEHLTLEGLRLLWELNSNN